ncbi:hypothetical protein BCR33DRAFT_741648, partial [Rhizoclosmatium globosum]
MATTEQKVLAAIILDNTLHDTTLDALRRHKPAPKPNYNVIKSSSSNSTVTNTPVGTSKTGKDWNNVSLLDASAHPYFNLKPTGITKQQLITSNPKLPFPKQSLKHQPPHQTPTSHTTTKSRPHPYLQPAVTARTAPEPTTLRRSGRLAGKGVALFTFKPIDDPVADLFQSNLDVETTEPVDLLSINFPLDPEDTTDFATAWLAAQPLPDPKTRNEAMSSPAYKEWHNAELQEIQSLLSNGT